MMNSRHRNGLVVYHRKIRQRGVILFVAMIALVVLMLAAIALVRAVDTNTLIAGNLAFKQSATISGDGGLQGAVRWLADNNALNLATKPEEDAGHFFNADHLAAGYYSSYNPNLSLTAQATWDVCGVACESNDGSGNTYRFIIQRMCRTANQILSDGDCLISDNLPENCSRREPCPIIAGKHAINRVTVRVQGPRNTISYIQAFIY